MGTSQIYFIYSILFDSFFKMKWMNFHEEILICIIEINKRQDLHKRNQQVAKLRNRNKECIIILVGFDVYFLVIECVRPFEIAD